MGNFATIGPSRSVIFFLFSLPIWLLASGTAIAQQELTSPPRAPGTLRAVFYNIENLFDTIDSPTSDDQEFLPSGAKQWNAWRLHRKITDVAKTIIAIGGWQAPELVGLCEVENESVLRQLTQRSPLSKYAYNHLHRDSPDPRGIDVALLYLPGALHLLDTGFIAVPLQEKTRDILHATFRTNRQDTLHVFVNHWPSRYGGQLASAPKRLLAARALHNAVAEVLLKNPQANILIMGDFNDEPTDASIAALCSPFAKSSPPLIQNIMPNERNLGTIYYKEITGIWQQFDQMMLSAALLDGKGLHTTTGANIFKAGWLLDEDGHPYRTYLGPFYQGGVSDHLPVWIDLVAE
jgi:endonuclease/exonuclease/phosphatase family metal-dependent hydrolase